jgi:hypothetical protein
VSVGICVCCTTSQPPSFDLYSCRLNPDHMGLRVLPNQPIQTVRQVCWLLSTCTEKDWRFSGRQEGGVKCGGNVVGAMSVAHVLSLRLFEGHAFLLPVIAMTKMARPRKRPKLFGLRSNWTTFCYLINVNKQWKTTLLHVQMSLPSMMKEKIKCVSLSNCVSYVCSDVYSSQCPTAVS